MLISGYGSAIWPPSSATSLLTRRYAATLCPIWRLVLNKKVCSIDPQNLTSFVGMLSGDPSHGLVQGDTELLERSQRACVTVQLCEVGVSPAAATLTSLFAGESHQHRDRRCEMCRVFAQDLESRLHLSRDRHLSQETVLPIVTDTCRRLGLVGFILVCLSEIATSHDSKWYRLTD